MGHTIKTSRLYLRPVSESDIGFFLGLASRPEYYEYDSETPQTAEELESECRWFIDRAQDLPDEGAIKWIAIYNGAKIGAVHVTCDWADTLEWDIGWYFLREYWGKGFASEAAKAVVAYVFENFKIHRLTAQCCAENVRSAALAQRIGMHKDGRMRENILINGAYYDEYVFSILRREVAP